MKNLRRMDFKDSREKGLSAKDPRTFLISNVIGFIQLNPRHI